MQALTNEVLNAVDGYQIYTLAFMKPDLACIEEERQTLNTKEFQYFQLRLIKTPKDAQKAVYIISENVYYLALDYHDLVRYYGTDAFLKEIYRLIPEDFQLRVNCLDSLDRTNVALANYFEYLGEPTHNFVAAGNAYSRQYASTDAMKQDLATFGHRTFSGRCKDLFIWAQRWYCNNFTDAVAHDGYLLAQYDGLLSEQAHFHINYFVFAFIYWTIILLVDITLLLFVFVKLRGLLFAIVLVGASLVFWLISYCGSQVFVLLPRFIQ